MLLKAVLVASALAVLIILGPLDTQSNTNTAKTNNQSVEWYREIIT